MTAPRWLATVNKHATNRVLGPLAGWLPWFGVVVHLGRSSGQRYRTPVNVFPRQDGFVVALTYGPEAQWVRNVMAAGGCELQTRSRTWRLDRPRLFHDDRRRPVPPFVRLPLRLLGAADFLDLSIAEDQRLAA